MIEELLFLRTSTEMPKVFTILMSSHKAQKTPTHLIPINITFINFQKHNGKAHGPPSAAREQGSTKFR